MTAFLSAATALVQAQPTENQRSLNFSSPVSQSQQTPSSHPSAISEEEKISSLEIAQNSPADLEFQQTPSSREIQAVWLSLRSRIAPMVMRLETAGGEETVDGTASIRESTGLLIDSDGFIFASATAFAHKPNAIIAVANDGKRFSAKLVSTDWVRKISLLKIDLPQNDSKTQNILPIPSAASIRDLRVGQKIAAFGRVVNPEIPDVSIGVVGGKNRQRGTAVQINAHISPNNYGGPVVDLDGNVIGILTPFGMGENKIMTGSELYDSGVGFAIPLEDLFALLPRMKNESDLRPAPKIGIIFTNPSAFLADPVVLHVADNSPAAKAEILVGDRITRVNETPVSTGADFRRETARYFEGDVLKLTIQRKNETFQREILLKDLEKKEEK